MIRRTTIAPETVGLYNPETRTQSIDETAAVTPATNEQLRQRVLAFLLSSNLPGLRHIEVEVQGDTVILRGSVRTFYEKQLAVRLSRRVASVIHVVDSIEAWAYVPRGDRPGTDPRPAAQNSPRPR